MISHIAINRPREKFLPQLPLQPHAIAGSSNSTTFYVLHIDYFSIRLANSFSIRSPSSKTSALSIVEAIDELEITSPSFLARIFTWERRNICDLSSERQALLVHEKHFFSNYNEKHHPKRVYDMGGQNTTFYSHARKRSLRNKVLGDLLPRNYHQQFRLTWREKQCKYYFVELLSDQQALIYFDCRLVDKQSLSFYAL